MGSADLAWQNAPRVLLVDSAIQVNSTLLVSLTIAPVTNALDAAVPVLTEDAAVATPQPLL